MNALICKVIKCQNICYKKCEPKFCCSMWIPPRLSKYIWINRGIKQNPLLVFVNLFEAFVKQNNKD